MVWVCIDVATLVDLWRKHVTRTLRYVMSSRRVRSFSAHTVWEDPFAGAYGFLNEIKSDSNLTYLHDTSATWRLFRRPREIDAFSTEVRCYNNIRVYDGEREKKTTNKTKPKKADSRAIIRSDSSCGVLRWRI